MIEYFIHKKYMLFLFFYSICTLFNVFRSTFFPYTILQKSKTAIKLYNNYYVISD